MSDEVERCNAMVSVSGYLIGSREANKKPLPPKADLAWWYQFYLATERGRAGYLEGDANGAPHPESSSDAKQFSGRCAHGTIKGGVGHNLPQEAPQAFAEAAIEVDGYRAQGRG
jgi:hypothetical protein